MQESAMDRDEWILAQAYAVRHRAIALERRSRTHHPGRPWATVRAGEAEAQARYSAGEARAARTVGEAVLRHVQASPRLRRSTEADVRHALEHIDATQQAAAACSEAWLGEARAGVPRAVHPLLLSQVLAAQSAAHAWHLAGHAWRGTSQLWRQVAQEIAAHVRY
jgi:hypothetical protein